MQITEKTKQAIISVATYCAQDMEYEYASDAEVVAETALDASRLKMNGHIEAHEEINRLVDEHGYQAVINEVAKFVPTA